MTMQEVLLTEYLDSSALPLYDKDPGPAYVINGAGFPEPLRAGDGELIPGEYVSESTLPHRVHVPMAYVIELKKSPDELVFKLVRHVAELGTSVECEDKFDTIRAYFTSHKLPLSTVIKHPSLALDVPMNVKVIEHEGVPEERFYCLTSPELLGRIPVRRSGTAIGDPENKPVPIEERGFLIFNPKGILTAFVEPPYP